MAGEWRKVSFEKLLAEPVRNGIYKAKEFHGRGAKIVNMGELFAYPRLRSVPMKRVELSASEESRFLLADGDLIFARRSLTAEGAGKCSVVLQLDEPTTFESSIIRARPDKSKANSLYLYYFFNSPSGLHALDTIRRQVAVAGITGSDLAKLEIPTPHLEEQRAIARILGVLDDKIDLNRRINQTLEAMAQAIFKSWFVDFDPVKAKIAAIEQGEDSPRAAMRAISGKTDAEIDQMPREHHDQLAATAALFPDAMEESELGDIPKGWNIKSVADLARYGVGKTAVSSLTIETYISTENMIENRGGVGRASSLPVVSAVPSFKKGQVLISNIRPYFKKIWMARFDGGRSNDVLCFEAKEEGCQEFIYNLLYQDDFFEFMMRTSKGAKMPRGDKDAIAGWTFPCASPELRCAFSERVRPFYLHIENLNLECRHISALRDTLLPKLLCGELKVPSNLSNEEGQ
nr:restriction endonuclease subunit S [Pandoraea sp. LA3]